MCVQIYHIHLSNGKVIDVAEDYELPLEKGLVEEYRKANPEDVISIGDCLSGYCYIPNKNIIFISTGDVRTV